MLLANNARSYRPSFNEPNCTAACGGNVSVRTVCVGVDWATLVVTLTAPNGPVSDTAVAGLLATKETMRSKLTVTLVTIDLCAAPLLITTPVTTAGWIVPFAVLEKALSPPMFFAVI